MEDPLSDVGDWGQYLRGTATEEAPKVEETKEEEKEKSDDDTVSLSTFFFYEFE